MPGKRAKNSLPIPYLHTERADSQQYFPKLRNDNHRVMAWTTLRFLILYLFSMDIEKKWSALIVLHWDSVW